MTRRTDREPLLPLDVRQPRPAGKRESDRVYAAVAFLRSVGRRVYRQGRQHRIDGAIADDGQLVRLAEGLFRDPGLQA